MENQNNQSKLITAGILLGMGAAGFFDGIVLHEILQWHHMLTSIRPITSIANLEVNTLWDGLFHAGMYALTVVGVLFLWGAANSNRPLCAKTCTASVLLGAGLFNVVEGIIDHQILGIHHVKTGPNQLAWDIGFLILSGGIAAAGWFLLQNQRLERV